MSIRSAISRKGLSVVKLASITGIPIATLRSYLSKYTTPTAKNVIKIRDSINKHVEMLGKSGPVTIDELFEVDHD